MKNKLQQTSKSRNFKVGILLICVLFIGSILKGQTASLHFDGTNDYIEIPNNSSLNLTQATFETWVYWEGNGYFDNIFMKGNYGWGAAIVANGQIEWWQQYTGGAGPNSNASVPKNVWTHIAITVTHNGSITFYINGDTAGTKTGALLENNTNNLMIGRQGTGCACNYFKGNMDEMRIWNTIRTQAQIKANMNREISAQTGLIAYYKFNEGTPNANNTSLSQLTDASSNAFNGTLYNFAKTGTTSNWSNQFKPAGAALHFDGSNDRITIAHNANQINLNALTMEAWVRVQRSGADRNIIMKGNYGYGMIVDASGRLGYWCNAQYYWNCPAFGTVFENVWTHVAIVVVKNTSVTFYINGINVGSSTLSSHTVINNGSSGDLFLGYQGTGCNCNYFKGAMDEVRIWNLARTQKEIQDNMYNEISAQTGLIHYYNFNEGKPNGSNTALSQVVDASSSALNGTLNNFAKTGTTSNWVNAVGFPKLLVKGNNIKIMDDDVTPSVSDHTSFGSIKIGNTLTRNFRLFNTGEDTLYISKIMSSGTNATDFKITNVPSKLAMGDSSIFTITFTPKNTNIHNATITMYNNDLELDTFVFDVSGNGITPKIEVKGKGMNIADNDITPSLADNTNFGSVKLESSIAQNYKIYNVGSDTLKITNIASVGNHASDFIVSNIPTLILVGDSATFTVTFNSTLLGLRTTFISILNNDLDLDTFDFKVEANSTTPKITVKGNGIAIMDDDVTPSLLDSTDMGSSANTIRRKYRIVNTGTDTLKINNIYSSGANASEFTITNAPAWIMAGDSATFQIQFNSNTVGLRSALISIISNDLDLDTFDFGVKAEKIAITNALKNNKTSLFSCYPNPFQNKLNITIPQIAESERAIIIITDVTGKIVHTSASNQENSLLDLNSLSNGVYQLTVSANKEKWTLKVVKQ